MSVRRDTIRYGAAAGALALVVIVGSALLVNSSYLPWTGTNSTPKALLVIQLTDPPSVPLGTTSLNLTYSGLTLLAGEPTGIHNEMNVESVPVSVPGGSVALDLLQLQNVSQTIGSVSLPAGSVVYTMTFTVSNIRVEINGTNYGVSLAAGDHNFMVTMADQFELQGTSVALLQLNPVVVNTPSGFKLIPSSVGILHPSEGQGETTVGTRHQLTNADIWDLNHANGVSRYGPT